MALHSLLNIKRKAKREGVSTISLSGLLFTPEAQPSLNFYKTENKRSLCSFYLNLM
jgi:hypothetical protein